MQIWLECKNFKTWFSRRKLYPVFLIGVVFISSPWFPGEHDNLFESWWISFLFILFLDTSYKSKVGNVWWILWLHGTYKQVWDFSSNYGSLVKVLKSLVNQNWVVKRGTNKIPVANSTSILFKTCEIKKKQEMHCLSVFDHFVELALKGLTKENSMQQVLFRFSMSKGSIIRLLVTIKNFGQLKSL